MIGVYYYNEATGESQWTVPSQVVAPPPAPPPPPPRIAEASRSPEIQNTISQSTTQADPTVYPIVVAPLGSSLLPPPKQPPPPPPKHKQPVDRSMSNPMPLAYSTPSAAQQAAELLVTGSQRPQSTHVDLRPSYHPSSPWTAPAKPLGPPHRHRTDSDAEKPSTPTQAALLQSCSASSTPPSRPESCGSVSRRTTVREVRERPQLLLLC